MSNDTTSVFFWILVLAAAAIVGWFGALVASRLIRRRLNTEDTRHAFTLQDLRDLRAQSAITEAEFQSMRAAMLSRHTAPSHDKSTSDEPDIRNGGSDDNDRFHPDL